MTLHSSIFRGIAILLSMTVPVSVWAETHFQTSLGYPTHISRNRSAPFKISVDSTQPFLFLQSMVSPFSPSYAADVMGLIPLTSQPRYIPFLEVHARFNHHRFHLLGVGFGFRHNIDYQSVLGAHIFLDQLYNQAFFHALSAHIEWMTPHLEISLNGCFPFTQTQRLAHALNAIPAGEIQYQHDPTHHALYALYHQKTVTLGPSVELTLSKRFDRLKCTGGLYIQSTPGRLGLLAGVEYSLSHRFHMMINLTHELNYASTRVTFGFRLKLAAYTPSPGSLQARLYAPIACYTFYAAEPLPIEYTQEATKTRLLIDPYAWVPEPADFNQTLINVVDSSATFYLRNQDETGNVIHYGTSNEPLRLKAGQSIRGTDAHLRPLSTEIELNKDNNPIVNIPSIENTLTLTGQNTLKTIWLKNSLVLENDNNNINGLYIKQLRSLNQNSKGIHIKKGSKNHLKNVILVANTNGYPNNTIKKLFGIYIENNEKIKLSKLNLQVWSTGNIIPGAPSKYHGEIYGIYLSKSTATIRNTDISINIADSFSVPLGNELTIGTIYNLVANHESSVKIISSNMKRKITNKHSIYETFLTDDTSFIEEKNEAGHIFHGAVPQS